MKTLFYSKTLIALAVAVAAAAGAVSQAQEQPIPPPAAESTLPANILPGSPLAEVVKLVQAGVEVGTINSYILNSASAFNLDAEKIIYLKDVGVPNDLVNAMLERDKILYAASVTPAPAPAPAPTAAPAPAPVSTVAESAPTAPPPAQVTVNYFYDTLTPYGSWVVVEGYGRCWRPTVVNYDVGWRPYCDRGRWVYTDCGWYWDSDYSWGATFHYGRWFRDGRFGWCWYPDTVWAPSWVTWRTGGEYCGWAPLPPFAVFQPGFGFYYRGASVAMGFSFGLDAGCFTFVSQNHFCDRRPRYYCADPHRATQIYNQTTVINDYSVHNTTIVNRGIPVHQVSAVTRRSIEPVNVNTLPNAQRHGWRGDGVNRSGQNVATDNNNSSRNNPGGNSQIRRGPASHTDQNSDANVNHRQNAGQTTAQTPNQNGIQIAPGHSQTSDQPGNRSGQRQRDGTSPAANSQIRSAGVNAPANNNNGQTAAQVANQSGSQITSGHSQTSDQPGNRNVQRQRDGTSPVVNSQMQPAGVNTPANNNNGQTVYQVQRANKPQVAGNASQPAAPIIIAGTPAPRQLQNTRPSGGNNYVPPQNQSPSIATVQPQPQARQYNNAAVIPDRSGAQYHAVQPPAASVRTPPPIPQTQPRQFAAPSQQRVEPVTRSYTPPPSPPATSQSQPRSSNNNANNGSNRGSNQTTDQNKPTH